MFLPTFFVAVCTFYVTIVELTLKYAYAAYEHSIRTHITVLLSPSHAHNLIATLSHCSVHFPGATRRGKM